MQRPPEYENLIKTRAFEPVARTEGALEIRLVSGAHARRNETTYRSPFPPISRAEAQAMIDILEKALPIARALTSQQA